MHFLIIWKPGELKSFTSIASGLKSPDTMSGRGSEFLDQGWFTVKGNSLCVTAIHIILNAHESVFCYYVEKT